MRAQTLLAVLGAALVLAGSVAADAGSVTLNPNASATLTTLSLKTGDVVDYQIASGFPVNFTIDRQGASDPISTTGQAISGSFTAPQDGQYSFSVTNEGAYMTGVSWNVAPRAPATPPSSGASPIVIAGIAGAAGAGVLGLGLWIRMRRRAPTGAPRPPAPPAP